ncbi:hypothetical protein ABE042_08840 [Viridibacillus arvi]|uniref:hypothetical protein n=1 Tax=Viridibacillus arvi TaxID=263475 RepID=UPI003D26C025
MAGYNDSTYEGDKEKLAKGTEIVLATSGILTILLPFFLYWFGNTVGIIFFLIIVLAVIVSIRMKSKQ